MDALQKARATPLEQFRRLDGLVNSGARQDERTQLLMSVLGVGALISLTFVSAIDDPARFRSSRTVGAQLGLT
ncbi:MAG: transposase [Sphingomonadales bacterium]|nr:transposase [Sphingomonadales bacterium]MDE2172093.1 transposase [Sphingomonadales bacterium]